MKGNKIAYKGLYCHVNTKAAFMDRCMREAKIKNLVVSAMMTADKRENLFQITDSRCGMVEMQMEWDDMNKEQMYDTLVGKRLSARKLEQFSDADRMLMEPILYMHQKEIQIDSIPFIVYGIVRNERSRTMLMEVTRDHAVQYCDAYRESAYYGTRFLEWFLLEERKAARIAIGFMMLLRKEEEDSSRYQLLMDIIYAGYRPMKNTIKKMHTFQGESLKDYMSYDNSMELDLSQMMLQLVIAEDLEIPIIQDYEFCQVVCMFMRYENGWLHDGGREEQDLSEGRRVYRRFLKEHNHPESYFASEYLEMSGDEEDRVQECEEKERMRELFRLFGLELRMLSGICLERKEAENLCAVFEEKEWEAYRQLLLIATLCKYIRQIEVLYEADNPEEIRYRKLYEEKTVMRLECEMSHMEEKVETLERQKQEKESELAVAKVRIEKLENLQKENEEQYKKEKEELTALRNFIFQMGEEEEREEDGIKDENQESEIDGLGRSIVIGGHRNWQKKMRKCLPQSQFLTSDHMNFDAAILRNKEYIIFNTDILKHGLYYKIMNEKKKGQKVLYVHGNNVGRTLREIANQL